MQDRVCEAVPCEGCHVIVVAAQRLSHSCRNAADTDQRLLMPCREGLGLMTWCSGQPRWPAAPSFKLTCWPMAMLTTHRGQVTLFDKCTNTC